MTEYNKFTNHVVHTGKMDDLEKIDNPSNNLVLMWRAPEPKLRQLMQIFKEKKISFNLDQVVDVEKCTEPVKKILDEHNISANFWLEDIDILCKNLAGLESTNQVRLKLHTVTEDECRLFHVDYVCLRLITTYDGPGTQWVPNYGVDRSQLGQPGHSFDEINGRIVKDVRDVKYVPLGAIALMKGENYPGNEGRGLVHRSTPIEQMKLSRIRLCVDSAHKHGEKK